MIRARLLAVGVSLFFPLALAGCGGSSGGSDDPVVEGSNPPAENAGINVSGVVRDYYTGEPIQGADVSVGSTGENLAETTTDNNGRFELTVAENQPRISVNADAEGFGGTSSIAATDGSMTSSGLELSLLPSHLIHTFSSAEATTLAVDSLDVVELEANAFVRPDGSAYSGNVYSELTIIDPSSDPGVMPGGYQALGLDGTEGLMESWGAITATFESESGQALQLMQGKPATIRIPVAEGRSASPASIPLFYYDQDIGIWREEGSATLRNENGISFYQGSVEHFSSWNADVLYEAVDVVGRVVDENGAPVANASVRSQGQDYLGSSTTRTAADGTFRLPVRPDSDVLIAASGNALSNTITVPVPAADYALGNDIVLSQAAVAITLTWGEAPRDLDSHFFGPEDSLGSNEFHVYFASKTAIADEVLINLDVDDTSSFGPEVITVPSFPNPGTYRYMVHLFRGSGTIASSPARVEITIGDESRVFSPTNAQGDVADWWAVANFLVDADGNVSVQAVQEWRGSSANPVQAVVRSAALGRMESSARTKVKAKYYSR